MKSQTLVVIVLINDTVVIYCHDVANIYCRRVNDVVMVHRYWLSFIV